MLHSLELLVQFLLRQYFRQELKGFEYVLSSQHTIRKPCPLDYYCSSIPCLFVRLKDNLQHPSNQHSCTSHQQLPGSFREITLPKQYHRIYFHSNPSKLFPEGDYFLHQLFLNSTGFLPANNLGKNLGIISDYHLRELLNRARKTHSLFL